jgi:5'-nucleotidase
VLNRPLAALAAATLLASPAAAHAAPAAAKAPKPPKPIHVLVTNDDGVAAPGIDAVVRALKQRPKVRVTVVAPAKNQSGTGGKTTPGRLTAKRATTKSGVKAVAVNGTPADSVRYALENTLKRDRPDLVVSGVNEGANLGPFVDLSGTVGAARAAAARKIPALATSQGFGSPVDFAAGVKQTVAWFDAHRGKLARGTVFNLNTPSCAQGAVRGVKTTTSGTDMLGNDLLAGVDCAAGATPVNGTDVATFYAGFAVLAKIPVAPKG